MTTLPHISSQLQTLLKTTTDTLALEQSYVKRPDRAKFTPSTLVQTLVLGWWADPDATLEQLAQMALRVGVEVSPQATDNASRPRLPAYFRQCLLPVCSTSCVPHPSLSPSSNALGASWSTIARPFPCPMHLPPPGVAVEMTPRAAPLASNAAYRLTCSQAHSVDWTWPTHGPLTMHCGVVPVPWTDIHLSVTQPVRDRRSPSFHSSRVYCFLSSSPPGVVTSWLSSAHPCQEFSRIELHSGLVSSGI